MKLGENIKLYRKDAGLTQKALAAKSGLSFSMVSKLESGEQSNPSYETLKKIAEVLRVGPGDLVAVPVSIEDQIDEYIKYKRGLSPNVSEKDSASEDLDFRRRLHAVNSMQLQACAGCNAYPDQPEACPEDPPEGRPKDRLKDRPEDRPWDRPEDRPELKRLVTTLSNSSKEDIDRITKLAEMLICPSGSDSRL